MEGNFLGPKTTTALANMIQTNKSLRVIDLENNNLTLGGTDTAGVIALADALRKNDAVLSLNLYNTQLDERCG